jgi:hypothetical protein
MLLILTAMVGGLFFLRPVRPPLLRRAHRIADVSAWEGWWWLDEHTVFVVEEIPSNSCTAFLLNTASGKRVALLTLSRTLSKLGSDCRLELSPNGKWMIVALSWKVAPHTYWLISVPSGEIRARHPASYFVEWLPDSSGWLGGSVGKKSRSLFRIDGGQALPLPSPSAIPGVDLGFSAAGDLCIGEYDPYSRADLRLHEIDLKTGRVRRTQHIPLPPSCLLSEVALSPDRKRLAWQVRPAPPPYIPAIIDRYLGSLASSRDVNAIWISNANGTGMKIIGEFTVKYGIDYDCDLSLHWLPDSRHLGVISRHTLYTLSAD